jgi:hypothetical protein
MIALRDFEKLIVELQAFDRLAKSLESSDVSS